MTIICHAVKGIVEDLLKQSKYYGGGPLAIPFMWNIFVKCKIKCG